LVTTDKGASARALCVSARAETEKNKFSSVFRQHTHRIGFLFFASVSLEKKEKHPHTTTTTMTDPATNGAEEELVDYEEEEVVEPAKAGGAGGDAGAGAGGAAVKKGYVGIHSSGFKDFLLKPELLRAIVDCGFEHPSEGACACAGACGAWGGRGRILMARRRFLFFSRPAALSPRPARSEPTRSPSTPARLELVDTFR
jgi:hypothetical protein